MLFIIYFMLKQFRLLIELKRSYLRQFWSFIGTRIIICSWIVVRISIWWYQELNHIQSLFKQINGYVYINLQFVSYVNDILTFLFGFCCFFGTIKFLHTCRFNARLSLFNQTLRSSAKQLISFTIMFSIIFISFLYLFYLLFNSKLWSCSTLLQTSQMFFEMMLLKFDATEINNAASFLGWKRPSEIENISNRIDQLLDAINRVNFDEVIINNILFIALYWSKTRSLTNMTKSILIVWSKSSYFSVTIAC